METKKNIEKILEAENYANIVVDIERVRFDCQIDVGNEGLKKISWFKNFMWKNFNFKHKDILDYEFFILEGNKNKSKFENGGEKKIWVEAFFKKLVELDNYNIEISNSNLDSILDKISEKGVESLTDKEINFLNNYTDTI